jgi:hypothetical protein
MSGLPWHQHLGEEAENPDVNKNHYLGTPTIKGVKMSFN